MDQCDIFNLTTSVMKDNSLTPWMHYSEDVASTIRKVNNTIKDICAKDREFSILCRNVGVYEIVKSIISFLGYETINEEFFNLSRKEVKGVVRMAVAL